MMNAKGEKKTVTTETLVETIRRARVNHVVGIRDKKTNEGGAALFQGKKLRLVVTEAEMQAVSDLLTVNEMEALFNHQEGQG